MSSIDLEDCVRRACLLEATARKPGNVHPGASFAHLTYADFVRSAEVISPVIAQVAERGVGKTVLQAVEATLDECDGNPNLGIVLLLTPLAAVPPDRALADGIADVLRNLSQDDAAHVYAAIRLAQPRGLGSAEDQDLTSGEPEGTLKEVMELAADRDLVARQYASNFELVLDRGMHVLCARGKFEDDWEEAVIHLQLDLMIREPETDIARKCGPLDAHESSRKASAVRNAGWPMTTEGRLRLREFDRWLRARGSLRNPGTAADLVTACLFAGIREGRIVGPTVQEIRSHAERTVNSEQ